uniref:Uncharacterized protein n=1 Tax=Gopherus evgoodei TaxID=1825980 RepID=A0A8C4W7V2_9SAUR
MFLISTLLTATPLILRVLLISTVVRQGKDIQGFYPGQLGRVHKACIPFIKLHPAPVQHEVETQYPHDFDNLTLQSYVPFQRTVKKAMNDWYKQTTYKEEFALPFYNMGKRDKMNCCRMSSSKEIGRRQPMNWKRRLLTFVTVVLRDVLLISIPVRCARRACTLVGRFLS